MNRANKHAAAEKASAGTELIAMAINACDMSDPGAHEHDCVRSRTALRTSDRFSNFRRLAESVNSWLFGISQTNSLPLVLTVSTWKFNGRLHSFVVVTILGSMTFTEIVVIVVVGAGGVLSNALGAIDGRPFCGSGATNASLQFSFSLSATHCFVAMTCAFNPAARLLPSFFHP